MSTVLTRRVEDRSAWYGPELAQDTSWIYRLTSEDLDDLMAALKVAQANRVTGDAITPAVFPIRKMAAVVKEMHQELHFGRGFVVIRGLPVEDLSETDAGIVYAGIGSHFGEAVPQNAAGHYLGHISDQGLDYNNPNVRGYQTNNFLPFHTDSADIVGLLCLHPAKSGGLSSVTSSVTIHNELLAKHRELLGVLYTTFEWDRRGEVEPGGEPVFRQPVFSYEDGYLGGRYTRDYIISSQEKTGRIMSAVELEVVNMFHDLASSPDLRLDMDLHAGDMQFLHNSVTVHSRTDYIDHQEPERKRHLLRLWLNSSDGRPVPEPFKKRRAGVLVNVGVH